MDSIYSLRGIKIGAARVAYYTSEIGDNIYLTYYLQGYEVKIQTEVN